MIEQGFQPTPLYPGDAGILAFPEITVVNQQQIGLLCHSRLDQCLACGHAADNACHLVTPFNLKSVRTIVTKISGIQQPVAILDKFIAVYQVYYPPKRLKFAFVPLIRDNYTNIEK